jgi:hypothetical protein
MPAPGQVNVGRINALHITFTMPVDASSVNAESVEVIRLGDGYKRAIRKFDFSDDGKTVTIKLYRGLKEGEDYKVVIKEGLRAFDGTPLSKDSPYYEPAANQWCFYFSTASSTKMEYAMIGGKKARLGEELSDVPIHAKIEVLFTRALRPESVNQNTVYLERIHPKQERVTVRVSYNEARRGILIEPYSYLHYQSRYRITISGVRDRLGNIIE